VTGAFDDDLSPDELCGLLGLMYDMVKRAVSSQPCITQVRLSKVNHGADQSDGARATLWIGRLEGLSQLEMYCASGTTAATDEHG
jgi:hypothetical protein